MRAFMYVGAARGRTRRHIFMVALVAAVVVAIPITASMMTSEDAANPDKGQNDTENSNPGDGQKAMASANPSTDPKPVNGYVYNLGGLPVSGASVTVQMINGVTIVDTQTSPFPTGPDGFYAVTFDPTKWDIGWTIQIEAVRSPEIGVNFTVCDDAFSQYLNATLGLIIPEFSSYAPVIGVSLFVAVLVVSSSRRARKAA